MTDLYDELEERVTRTVATAIDGAYRLGLRHAIQRLEAMPLPDDPAPYLSKYQYGGATRQAAVAAVRALLEEPYKD